MAHQAYGDWSERINTLELDTVQTPTGGCSQARVNARSVNMRRRVEKTPSGCKLLSAGKGDSNTISTIVPPEVTANCASGSAEVAALFYLLGVKVRRRSCVGCESSGSAWNCIRNCKTRVLEEERCSGEIRRYQWNTGFSGQY